VVGEKDHQRVGEQMLVLEEIPELPENIIDVAQFHVVARLAAGRPLALGQLVRSVQIVEMKKEEER